MYSSYLFGVNASPVRFPDFFEVLTKRKEIPIETADRELAQSEHSPWADYTRTGLLSQSGTCSYPGKIVGSPHLTAFERELQAIYRWIIGVSQA